MRHSPKSRRNARGRPHRWQRLYLRTLNFGVRFHFSTIDFFAKPAPLDRRAYRCRKGMFMSRSSSCPSSSFRAEVTNVMSIPRIFSTLS
jgi:hypothetical protein